MSKRKGRKPARSSEIKSVLRAPSDGENELEAEGGESASGEADTLPLDVLAEVVEPEASAEPAPEEAGVESEPTPPVESAPAPRQRRLRAVRAARSAPLDEAVEDASDAGPDGEADDSERRVKAEDDGDDIAVAAGRDGVDDATDADNGGDDAGDDEPFVPFPIDAEGDDTEGFLRGLLEALLFTSQKPLDLKDLARSAGVDKPRAKELLEQLMASYEGRGVCIEQVAGGFVMRSSPRYAPYIQKILALRPVRLSRAQLETLAIVAYRQPVTKPEVDDIRGVDSGQVIKGLLERSLLKMLGKKDEPGRPTLYGTTPDFLELLNLQSLKDLPTLREYTELSEESQRKFLDETGEAPPSGAISFERPPAPAAEGSGSEGEQATQSGIEPGTEAALDGDGDSAPAESADARDELGSPEDTEATSEDLEPVAQDPSEREDDDDNEAGKGQAPRAASDEESDDEAGDDDDSDDEDADDEDSDDDADDDDEDDSDDDDEDDSDDDEDDSDDDEDDSDDDDEDDE